MKKFFIPVHVFALFLTTMAFKAAPLQAQAPDKQKVAASNMDKAVDANRTGASEVEVSTGIHHSTGTKRTNVRPKPRKTGRRSDNTGTGIGTGSSGTTTDTGKTDTSLTPDSSGSRSDGTPRSGAGSTSGAVSGR